MMTSAEYEQNFEQRQKIRNTRIEIDLNVFEIDFDSSIMCKKPRILLVIVEFAEPHLNE
jgi:hypothetical protein